MGYTVQFQQAMGVTLEDRNKIGQHQATKNRNKVRTMCINLAIMMTSSTETCSALLALCEGNPPVIDGCPSQTPVTRGFGVFFDLHPNKRLSKQSRHRGFETQLRPLWRHCNDAIYTVYPSRLPSSECLLIVFDEFNIMSFGPLETWVDITMTSHESHVVPNHRWNDCLFNSLCGFK